MKLCEKNKKISDYVDEVSWKSDLERTTSKEKTGVFTGIYAYHPISNERIPIWVSDYVLASYGTGAVMAVPAHDQRDYEFASLFNLEIKQVIRPKKDKVQIDENAFTEEGILMNSMDFNDLTSQQAKEVISERLKSLNKGTLITLYKLRDWLFSRQRYWGEPIPIYFPVEFEDKTLTADDVDLCQNAHSIPHTILYDKPIPLKEEDLPLNLPKMSNFLPGDDPAGCLARNNEWRYFKQDNQWYARETNTMPQWAGSCWYYLRFLDPNNDKQSWTKELDEDWMPVDLYIGGSEHAVLHLLYARFWHLVLFDLGFTKHSEPFTKLVHQGMILGTDGEKMSKSRGNVINPDNIIKSFGADALRLYEMFMGPLEAVKPWQTQQIAGVVRFQNKIYNLVQTLSNLPKDSLIDKVPKEDVKTLNLLNKTIKKVSDDLELMQFNTAISAMMVLCNHLTKLGKSCPIEAIETFILLISPFAPHLAEESWNLLGNPNTLAFEPWLTYDESFIVSETTCIGVQINGKVRGEINLSLEDSEEVAMDQAKQIPKVADYLLGKTVKKIIYVPGRILNIVLGK